MFNFGTSYEQVLYPKMAEIVTSNRQALVSINKPIQTLKNNLKQGDLNFENSEIKKKTRATVPIGDNLKTTTDKNYSEPL